MARFHYALQNVQTAPGFTEHYIYHVDGSRVRIENFTEGDASVGHYVGESSFTAVDRAAARTHLRELLAAADDYNGISVTALN